MLHNNILIFIILIYYYEIEAFGRQKNNNINDKLSIKNDINENKNIFTKKLNEYNEYDPYCDCNNVGFKIVQKIPYHVPSTLHSINMTSSCVRCDLCLAIADKINVTLIDLHDVTSPDKFLNDTEVELLFGIVCNEAFKKMREINGQRYIGDSLPQSVIFESSNDELWETLLKKRCWEIVEIIGAVKIYEKWKEWYDGCDKNLKSILCNGEFEILRDCRGIKKYFSN
ncbi:uncharacterized protein LOC122854836 [Aphidius gifuensis]|uniref:uncharacterized protein LOC122854836 n=1 Tax=Aphidius gifuensis TaxID=684658 RepID=UPI001CDBD7F3|nr:uncharacterized protein LOC122854836 [Aphidius gifuensis]